MKPCLFGVGSPHSINLSNGKNLYCKMKVKTKYILVISKFKLKLINIFIVKEYYFWYHLLIKIVNIYYISFFIIKI